MGRVEKNKDLVHMCNVHCTDSLLFLHIDIYFLIDTAKVRSILVTSYFIHMRLNVNGSIVLHKKLLKKINLMKGLVSVQFFTSKDPLMLSLICIK